MRRLEIFPLVEIRYIDADFSPVAWLRNKTFSSSIQQPSQPKSDLDVIRTAFCVAISNVHNAGSGPSQSLRFASSPMAVERKSRFPSGDTSTRPSPLVPPFGIVLSIGHFASS